MGKRSQDISAQVSTSGTGSRGRISAFVSSLAEEYLFIVLILLMMIRPFVSGRTFPWSNTWFQLAWICCAAMWLARSVGFKVLPFRNPLPTGLLAGFTAVCALTMLTGIDTNESYRGLCELIGYLLATYLVLHVTRDHKAVRRFVIALVIASALISIYGYIQRVYILEYARREYLLRQDLYDRTVVGGMSKAFWERMQANRIFSTFLHAGSLAGYLAVCMPLTCGLMAGYRRRRHLVALTAILVFQCTALLLTATRGAWLALTISSCVAAALAIKDWKRLGKRRVPLIVSFAVAGVLATLFTLTAGVVADALSPVPEASPGTEVAETAQGPADQDLSGVTPDAKKLMEKGTLVARLTYWHGAWGMFKARPVFGMGWSTFGRAYPKYLQRGGYPTQFAHNDWLQVLAETGLLGFVFYAGFWLAVMIPGFRLSVDRQAPVELRWLRAGIFCALLTFLLHGMVDFDLYIPGIALLVFVLAALLMATETRTPRRIPMNMVGMSVGTVALAFAVGFCFCPYKADSIFDNELKVKNQIRTADSLFNGRPVKAEVAAVLLTPDELERISSGRVSPRERNAIVLDHLATLRDRIETARMFNRFDSRFAGYLGVIDHISSHSGVDTVKYIDRAILHYKKACELSPLDFNHTLNLARAYVERGNWPGNTKKEISRYYSQALQQFQTAAGLYQYNPHIWQEWGQILRGMGQEEKGLQYQRKADELRKDFIT